MWYSTISWSLNFKALCKLIYFILNTNVWYLLWLLIDIIMGYPWVDHIFMNTSYMTRISLDTWFRATSVGESLFSWKSHSSCWRQAIQHKPVHLKKKCWVVLSLWRKLNKVLGSDWGEDNYTPFKGSDIRAEAWGVRRSHLSEDFWELLSPERKQEI